MNGEKDLKVALLLDHYAPLLTEKQRDVIDLYYNEDLSLGEIAEQENITRQGVRDSIKRGEQTLYDLENALGLAEKSSRLDHIAERLSVIAENMSESAELKKCISEIKNIF
ncbi:MAG: YlxM family DNA-binding protein [Huintestinicola sp.]